ncbi:tripartite tricarboxylate transporter substrate binding protein [Variovorax sp. J22R115]|uniref:Bug family tripartite tricarboxylate transporter substrate binding protein n=1 Tax=Variovorax sp. J22R115 TaxID=3053509 RepID=UPI0025756839|nr:tripartite tricarboxylate transporter substrate binding protein [Variovorax sp. J22R115]MDM0049428.1 tripartite tricarboxylate transporter substrate binding protein [Variovorax sp. J22R115]
MNRRGFQLTLAAAALGPHAWVRAQEPWPVKPIKVVLSQPAGSGPDNIARLLGDGLAQSIGQPFVIDNKPGGQNVIGAQAARQAAPDGYTFYFATTAALVTNSYLFKTLPYDPLKDFVPVAFVANSPFALLVNADSPIKSVDELIARSKAEPGKLSLANEGPRTFGGMIARLFNARAKAGANLVAYSSIGTGVQDLMGGHSEALVADVASTAQLVRQGRLRMLAVTSPKRIAGWDNVPALAETLPGVDMVGWLAVVAPAGTPEPIVTRMNAGINSMLANPAFAEKLLAIGPIAAPPQSPQQFDAFLRGEHRRLGQIAAEIGLLPE